MSCPDEGARAVSPYNGRRCDLRLGCISVPGRPGREGVFSRAPISTPMLGRDARHAAPGTPIPGPGRTGKRPVSRSGSR